MNKLHATPAAIALVVGLCGPIPIHSAEKTRDEQVIDDRAELQNNDTWIYNDLAKAKEAAGAAGKPLMIVFRCIP